MIVSLMVPSLPIGETAAGGARRTMPWDHSAEESLQLPWMP
ncbi:hypothetical protein [Arthrobacter subterraneus]|nr:hypothetical protein [Arthrobacter subterraneus]